MTLEAASELKWQQALGINMTTYMSPSVWGVTKQTWSLSSSWKCLWALPVPPELCQHSIHRVMLWILKVILNAELIKEKTQNNRAPQYFKHLPCFALQYSCITSCTSTNEKDQTRGKYKNLQQLLSVQLQNIYFREDYGKNTHLLYYLKIAKL